MKNEAETSVVGKELLHLRFGHLEAEREVGGGVGGGEPANSHDPGNIPVKNICFMTNGSPAGRPRPQMAVRRNGTRSNGSGRNASACSISFRRGLSMQLWCADLNAWQ